LPRCATCNFHHLGACRYCTKCRKYGHDTAYCRQEIEGQRNEGQKNEGQRNERRTAGIGSGCYECGANGHIKRNCPKLKRNSANQAHGRAFVIGTGDARQDPNVVTGMFLVNKQLARVLFDSGADLSFVSKQFRPLLGLESIKLENKYSIELANIKVVEATDVIKRCTLEMEGHSFSIDLLSVTLGSFNIVVGIDWLSKHHAEMICHEKQICVSMPKGEMINVQGETSRAPLGIVSCMKARRYLQKGYVSFLAHVKDSEAKEKELEDILVVRDYPEVFPKDLPGLPPPRQVEFRIDLVPGAASVAKSPYRLAPSEMKELSEQIQEC
jgi:hypothetical protein